MGRFLKNEGAHKETSNVFDAVADYHQTLGTTLAWLFSPVLGLSLAINEVYQFINKTEKWNDATIVIGEVLFNQSEEEVVAVGKFRIRVNSDKYLVVDDIESGESINTHRTREAVVADFEKGLAWAIGSSSNSLPEGVNELYKKLEGRVEEKKRIKTDVINKMLISPQAVESLQQFSIQDLRRLERLMPKNGEDNFLSIINGMGGMMGHLHEPFSVSGIFYHLGSNNGRYFLHENPPMYMNGRGPLKEIELLSMRDLVISCKLKLNNQQLVNTDLSKANLENANLENACLAASSFSGADLRGANMRNVDICAANFSGAKFNGTEPFTLKLPRWNLARLDMELNHLNNPSGSILKAIDSIDDVYAGHKLNLMHQLIKSFKAQRVDTSSVNEALLDIWMKNPLYVNDEEIQHHIQLILFRKIIHAEKSALRVTGQQELQLLLNYIKKVPTELLTNFLLENNNFLVQLVMLCTQDNCDDDMKKQAIALYEIYLDLPELSNGKRDMEMNGGDIREKNDKGLAFVFFKKNGDDSYHLLLDEKQMQKMLASASDVDWDIVYSLKNGEILRDQNLTETFSIFSLFNSAYQFHLNQHKLVNVLKVFSFDYINEGNDPGLLSKNYLPLIEDAFKVTTLYVRGAGKPDKYVLTGKADQDTLKKIFRPLLSKELSLPINDQVNAEARSISGEHGKAIITALSLSNATDAEKARGLFSLAAVVTKLSSAYFFGSEDNSPEAIREYAAGLMIKAHQLDPSVYGTSDRIQRTNFTDWMKRLLGGKNENGSDAFSCTAVLAGLMFDHANTQQDIEKIMNAGIRPTGWL
jgi:uncharacterized protein YjbI with pentapeptide repeats